MNEPELLAAEYHSADELLRRLVAFEVRRTAARPLGPHAAVERPSPLTAAVNDGFRRVLRWPAHDRSPLGLVARQAAADAVAADTIRAQFPKEAAALERPWRTAVRVRHHLRVSGPSAEAVARRLLPSWRLPLEELPGAAAALAPSR